MFVLFVEYFLIYFDQMLFELELIEARPCIMVLYICHTMPESLCGQNAGRVLDAVLFSRDHVARSF